MAVVVGKSQEAAGADPAAAAGTASLWRYSGPQYWLTWVFVAWLRLTSVLPLRTAINLHKHFGHLLWIVAPRRRRIVKRNLEICFPALDAHEIEALAFSHFENVGACIAEIAFAWFAKPERMAHLFRVEGREHVDAALAKGNGVMLFSGHFTTLEICVPYVKALVPQFAFMFRPRHNALLNEFQIRGRLRASRASFANNDVRAMLRMLRKNAVVWYAPDQVRSGSGGELLTFFGEPAMTSTATSRLARVSGAAVVPFFFSRAADDSGYLLRFSAPLDDLPSDAAGRDTARLTAVLEGFVRESPEQYFWTHRKFKGRPADLPDAYAPAPTASATARSTAAQTSARRRHSPTAAAANGWLKLLGAPLAIAAVALFVALVDNTVLWRSLLGATTVDEHRGAILLSMFVIVFCSLTIVLALAIGTRLFKAVAAALLVIAAGCSFFMSEYGVVIDESMIRNVAETQIREASPLLTGAFFVHLAVFGFMPALVLICMPLGVVSMRRALAVRGGIVACSIVALVGTLYPNYGALSFFGHQNHTLRLQLNPGYPLYAAVQFLLHNADAADAVRAPLDARLAPADGVRQKPNLVVFVMGETARTDRFAYNGYARDTNRYTRPHNVVSFSNVTSCGTSTAESVPCLFSHLGRAGFTHAGAAANESVFGVLQRLGVEAFWRDNSTGCKNVCDEAHFEEFAARTDADFCDSTGCFDEILLKDIDGLVTDGSRDHFIVLHQRGSHGPAYHTDTPAWSKEFVPECNLPNLRNCDRDSINNAYDNTILYTDYFVSRVIDFLEGHSAQFNVAMLYVSDHGESLGENGIYLHGFPYSVAPQEQTRVPLLFWAAADFYSQNSIDSGCVRGTTQRTASHDSIFHTLLPIFDVETPRYRPDLDLFADCRRGVRHSGESRSTRQNPNQTEIPITIARSE